jgi:hypothetical protein
MECGYCHKILSSNYNLRNHQTNAKYCLKIRERIQASIISDTVTCEFCNKTVFPQNRKRHISVCKMRDKVLLDNSLEKIEEIERQNKEKIDELERQNKEKIEEIERQNKEKIQELNYEIDELKEDIIEKDQDISRLNCKLETYISMHDRSQKCVEEIAKQPRNTIIMSPLDLSEEKIDQSLEFFTKEYFSNGQKGVAQHAVKYLLKDEEGNPTIVCTDPSRGVFQFADKNGELHRDLHARKLTNKISKKICAKANEIAEPLINGDRFTADAYRDRLKRIQLLSHDNSEFKNELAINTVL